MSADATVREADRWAAAQCRVARRLFSLLGEEGAEPRDAGSMLLLTSLAGQFAWHASLFYDLLPVRAGVDRDELVAAAVGGADEALDELAGLLAREGSIAGCVALARVVAPRLLAGVEHEAGSVVATTDGPRARVLTLVARDLADARSALELLAERLVFESGAADEALLACVEVERRFVNAAVEFGVCGAGNA